MNMKMSAGAACTAFPKMYANTIHPMNTSPDIAVEHSVTPFSCFRGVVRNIVLEGGDEKYETSMTTQPIVKSTLKPVNEPANNVKTEMSCKTAPWSERAWYQG